MTVASMMERWRVPRVLEPGMPGIGIGDEANRRVSDWMSTLDAEESLVFDDDIVRALLIQERVMNFNLNCISTLYICGVSLQMFHSSPHTLPCYKFYAINIAKCVVKI